MTQGWAVIHVRGEDNYHYFNSDNSLCQRMWYHPRLHGKLYTDVPPLDHYLRCPRCLALLEDKEKKE